MRKEELAKDMDPDKLKVGSRMNMPIECWTCQMSVAQIFSFLTYKIACTKGLKPTGCMRPIRSWYATFKLSYC
jgi:hypothetical protein